MLLKLKRSHVGEKQFFVIKRISGGYIAGRATITNYEIVYPEDVFSATKRFLRFAIKCDGTSRKGTLYRKEKLHDHLGGVIADLFSIYHTSSVNASKT